MAKTVTLGLANSPTVTTLGGGTEKVAFIYPKDGIDKNCLKSFTGVH